MRLANKSAAFYFHADQIAWMALDYLNLYRLFVAMLFTGLLFTPVMTGVLQASQLAAGQAVTILYLVISPLLFVIGRRLHRHYALQASAGLGFDLLALMFMVHQLGGINSGIGALLIGAIGGSAVLFSSPISLLYAASGAVLLLWQALFEIFSRISPPGIITPACILGAIGFAASLGGSMLSRRARDSQEIVRQRSADLASLAELNELIIERMRTGILIVDQNNNTHLMNEAAWFLMGMPEKRSGKLDSLAADLQEDLENWRETRRHRNTTISLARGAPPIVARFAALSSDQSSDTLVFLEDASKLSRRAQEMTLNSLGRLSASIAHEIRNPLAAIHHSAQLLAESKDLGAEDRKLIDIVERHCRRMNEIIENVLQLARQQPAKPKQIILADWAGDFVEEFKNSQGIDGEISLEVLDDQAVALVDPIQLQQVVWNLCQNALKYGRIAPAPAVVTIRCGYASKRECPILEVLDQGPGISVEDRQRIFEPFYTSSLDGSGLGLYLVQHLCASNHASLEYYNNPTGGSCFRISMASVAPPKSEYSVKEWVMGSELPG